MLLYGMHRLAIIQGLESSRDGGFFFDKNVGVMKWHFAIVTYLFSVVCGYLL